MKLKKWKRLCGLLLAAVLVGSSFMQYTGVVRAEGEEPSYAASTCILKYERASETISAQSGGGVWYDSIAADQTYYVSFTAKSTNTFYFNYKGGTGRLVIKTDGYGLLGVADATNNQLWGNSNTGLNGAEGVKVTLCSESTKTTLWINGEKVKENISLTDDAAAKAGKPQVSWAEAELTLSDIKVWTVSDEPVYNAETDIMKYEAASELVSAGSAGQSWGVTIPENQTYYLSFKVQTTANLYFDYRGSQARILFGTDQYGLIGLETEKWPPGDFGLRKGVKITLRSDPDKTTFWLNGEKIVENAALSSTATGQKGIPQVSWADAEAILSDIKVWTAKDGSEEPPVSDEPVCDETKDKMYDITSVASGCTYADGVLTVPAETNAVMQTGLPSNAAYYMTLQVQTSDYVNLATRNGSYINLQPSGYQLVGTTSDAWVKSGLFAKLGTGVKITLYSDAVGFKMWVDGEKAIEAQYSTENSSANPNISWSFASLVTVSNIRIWRLSDEPRYDEMKDKLYDITSVADGCTYADGVLTVPAETNAVMQTGLPSNAAYYMTLQVQTSDYVNLATRNGSYINLQPSGYQLVGTTSDAWVKSGLFAKLGTGVKITLYSDAVGFKMWVDGEKAIEAQYSAADSSANPNVSWSFDSVVTASNIQIWTLNVAELAGNSITLDGNIGVNFYMNLGSAITPEEAVMNFTLPDGSTQQAVGSLTDDGYKYTCEVAAKKMTEEIKAQVVAGDAVSKEYTYSVKDYADTILSDEATYEKEIPLVKAMLNYGAYAQTYFGYNTEALANAGLTDTDVSGVTAATLNGFAKEAQSNAIAGLAGASLILESETTLKLYFTLSDEANVSSYTFSMGSETLTPEKSGTYYYVAITNIDAKNLDTDYTVKVTSGGTDLEVTYSPMTYCYNVLNGSYSDELKNVVRALYLYNSAANTYFA